MGSSCEAGHRGEERAWVHLPAAALGGPTPPRDGSRALAKGGGRLAPGGESLLSQGHGACHSS